MQKSNTRFVFNRPFSILFLIVLSIAIIGFMKDLKVSGNLSTITGNLEEIHYTIGTSYDSLYLTVDGENYEVIYSDKQSVYEALLLQFGSESPLGNVRQAQTTYTTQVANGAQCILHLAETSGFPVIVGLSCNGVEIADPDVGHAAWIQLCQRELYTAPAMGIFLLLCLIFIHPSKKR